MIGPRLSGFVRGLSHRRQSLRPVRHGVRGDRVDRTNYETTIADVMSGHLKLVMVARPRTMQRRVPFTADDAVGSQFNLRKIDFMKRRSEAMYSSMTCWRSSMRDLALFD